MSWTKFRISLLTLGALAATVGPTMAAGVTAVSTGRFGYVGSYTKYATEADALAGTGAIGSGTVARPGTPGPSTDLNLDLWSGVSAASDRTSIGTAWWYTTDVSGGIGVGNPFNNNLNFLQLVNSFPKAMVGSADAYWTSSAKTELRVTAAGANATQANSYARFGDNGALGDPATATYGEFLSYELDATFSGLNSATWDAGLGAFVSTGDPNGISVSGGLTALFHNDSAFDSNGYYVINLTFTNDSWVHANRDNLTGAYLYPESVFGASAVVPEPSSMVMAGLGVLGAGLGALLRSRRRQAS